LLSFYYVKKWRVQVSEKDYPARVFMLRGVVDRKTLAARMGMSYQTLSGRLNGFTSWVVGEEMAFTRLLKEYEGQAARLREGRGQVR
jgi:hypothetical protein